ncbi:MAG: hypothetical protein WCP10_15160 [Desulfuromonadales bacterium]
MNMFNAQLTVELPTLGPASLSDSYLNSANSLFVGAEELSKGTSEMAIACSFLCAQVVECTLKSYVSHVGVTEKDLKNNLLRHNLILLWGMAADKGLPINNEPPEWCNILSNTHDSPYVLRYQKGTMLIQTPDLILMIAEIKDLLLTIKAAIES